MTLSTYSKNNIANHQHGKATWTAPANIFIGLSTAEPLADGSGLAEPSGGDYDRASTAPTDWTTSTTGVTSNANAVTFPAPTGSWGTCRYVVRFDAASGGNIIDYAALPTAQTVDAGSTTPTFAVGYLTFTVT